MEDIGIGGKRMNKIGWCSITFNPVWGCLNKCEYCYARKIAKRFGKVIINEVDPYNCFSNNHGVQTLINNLKEMTNNFTPTFLDSQYYKRFPKKPQRIFVGSMSEIYYWKKEWMEKVIDKVKQYPQHTFQFLTKFPEVYSKWVFPENCWLGTTITGDEKFYKIIRRTPDNINFLSIEPMLNFIKLNRYYIGIYDWVIIGDETGNRKGKVIPKLEWITDIVKYCRNNKIPVYLKDSIIKLYPNIVFEYPNYHKFPDFYDKKEVR